jgi:hypothetical protein
VRALLALVVVAVGAGAFLAGRASVDRSAPDRAPGSFASGMRAGREAAFAGFDGGWGYGEPYIVTLRRGGPGVTYRFASRRPLLPGFEYRLCGKAVCTRISRPPQAAGRR